MISHIILPGISLCVFTLQKGTCSEEIINEIKLCISDKKWRPHFDVLLDLRLLDTMLPREEYVSVRDFILSTPISKNTKHAMVVSKPIIKKESKVWVKAIKPYKMTYWIFSSLDNALRWLGVSKEHYCLHIFHSKL